MKTRIEQELEKYETWPTEDLIQIRPRVGPDAGVAIDQILAERRYQETLGVNKALVHETRTYSRRTAWLVAATLAVGILGFLAVLLFK